MARCYSGDARRLGRSGSAFGRTMSGDQDKPLQKGDAWNLRKGNCLSYFFLKDSLVISFVHIHPRIWFPIFFLDEINIHEHVSN